jgi:hypothetical protein
VRATGHVFEERVELFKIGSDLQDEVLQLWVQEHRAATQASWGLGSPGELLQVGKDIRPRSAFVEDGEYRGCDVV